MHANLLIGWDGDRSTTGPIKRFACMPSTACWEFPCCNTSTGRRRWPGPGCPWNNCLRNSVKSCSSRCSIRLGRKKHPTVWPWFCQKRPWFSKAWPNSWAWTHCGRADKGNTRAAPSISFRSATYLCFFGIPSKLPLELKVALDELAELFAVFLAHVHEFHAVPVLADV